MNPYADTRILYGDPDTEVSSILVGIDLEVGEVLLADRLREKGQSRRPHVRPPPRGPRAGPPGRGDGACRPTCGASSECRSPTATRS